MKRLSWVLCGLLALCAADLTVFAEEENIDYYDDYYDDYYEDDYYDDDYIYDDYIDDVPIADVESESLSQKHLDVLDRLGALLDYESSVSENDLSDSSDGDFDDNFDDSFDDPVYDDGVVELLSSIDSSLSTLSDVSLYSDFTAFNGAISSTYLDLFRGFLPKLTYKQHYVLYRESQYVYSFVFGDDLSFDGSRFIGSSLTRVYFNASGSGTFGRSSESSFSLSPGSAVVYSDLGIYYPALSTDVGSNLIQLKWLILIALFAFWMIALLKGIRRRGDRDKRWSSVNTV